MADAARPAEPSTDRIGGRGVAGVVLLALGALLLACPGLLRGESLYLRDLSAFHRPLRALLARLSAASAGLPVWNPFTHFGQPFAANPNHAVFHPVHALYALLPFEPAFQVEVLSPLLLGLASAGFLLRTLGRSEGAAAFGALAWGLGGYALSAASYLQLSWCLAVLPATLAFTVRLVRRPGRHGLALLAACFGLQVLAGSPSGLIATALLVAAAALEGRREAAPGARPCPALGALAGALLLGLLVGSAVLVPAARLARLGGRVQDESFERERLGWSLPPLRVAELVAPRAFGHVVPTAVGWYWGRSLYGARQWPYIFSIYGGLLPFALALVALVHRPREQLAWKLAGLLGLLLAFGEHLPGGAVVHRLPPLSLVRFPEKLALLPALVLALLAARGLELVLREAPARQLALFTLSTVGTLAALFLAGGLAGQLASGSAFWEALGIPDWLAAAAGAAVLKDLALVIVLALAGVLATRGLAGRRARLAFGTVLAITAIDLSLAGRELMPTIPTELLTTPPRVLRPLIDAAPEGYLLQLADHGPKRVRRAGRVLVIQPPVPSQWGLATGFEKDFDGTQLAWSRAATPFCLDLMKEEPALAGPLLARRGVVAVLRLRGAGEKGEGAYELLRTRGARPLAFAVERVEAPPPGESPAATLRRLGAAAAGTAVLAADERLAVPLRVAPATVEIRERRPDRWTLGVAGAGPAPSFVAINQTWAPGWSAAIDGEEAPLLRVDLHLTGIVVPAGDHELRLRYRDRSLTLGLVLSAAGLLLLLALAISGRRLSDTMPSPARGRNHRAEEDHGPDEDHEDDQR